MLYVGKAKNLRKRVESYLRTGALGPKTEVLIAKTKQVDHIVVESELEALLLEANLIKNYAPPFNIRWTDGKAYPFIKITINDPYPAVVEARRIDDRKAIYFGPYPNIGDVRTIVKLVRRIFPFVSVRNHSKRPCLYYHLGLCPCPNVFPQEKKHYEKSVKLLVQFLEGRKDTVLRKLTKDMENHAQREHFEQAAFIKKQIDTIYLITQPIRDPMEYVRNPNLLSDEARLDLGELKKILAKNGLRTAHLSRIECYDISNIQGESAVGAMVVTTDGIIDKNQYRRFKIHFKTTPDDVAMLKEVLKRRLSHREWPTPNLVVIDGGIAQVNAARAIIGEVKAAIPVIGLAKRLEEIVMTKTKVVRLPQNNRALQLLQRLRDEAHRFALSYHHKLRQRHLFDIP